MKKTIYILLAITVLSLWTNTATAQFDDNIVSLTGSIYDDISRKPIAIHIEVVDERSEQIAATRSNSKDGFYFVTGLIPGNSYTMRFSAPDYFNQRFIVNIPNTDRYQEFSHDFLLKPKEKGIKLRLKVPPFELHKSKLRAGAEIFLKDYKNLLTDNPQVNVSILCYPDNNEDKKFNFKMTKERAEALKDFFVKAGVDESRMKAVGNETTDPDNPPPSEMRAKGKRYIGPIYVFIESF